MKKPLALVLAAVMLLSLLSACKSSADETPTVDPAETEQTTTPEETTPAEEQTPEEPQPSQEELDQAAADNVAALIDAIYVQSRTDETDAQCEAAKAAWDALTDAQKELVPADVLKTLTDAETAYANLPRSSGSGSSYTGGHTFTTDLEPGSITGVFVDGKKLDSRYYTVSGSDVTLTADYLKTLRSGKHTVRIENADKVATGTFTVEGKTGAVNASRTGDPGVAVYFAMGAMSFLGSAAWLRRRRDED